MSTPWVHENSARPARSKIVLATASPKNDPIKFVTAASMMAWRGVSTFVPTNRGDGVRGIVKAVRVGEQQRDEEDARRRGEFHSLGVLEKNVAR
jgi:hypothetical protein